MKYVLMFCGTEDDVRRYESMGQADREAQFARVGARFADSRIRGGLRAAPGTTATTVRFGASGDALVTDDPFIEGKGGHRRMGDRGGRRSGRGAGHGEVVARQGAVEVRPVHESDQG